MKFFLFVEGQTERGSLGDFLKRWLDPRLSHPVKISVVTLRGAGNYFANIRNQVEFYLDTQAKEQIISGLARISHK